jgi:hypothetical protein
MDSKGEMVDMRSLIRSSGLIVGAAVMFGLTLGASNASADPIDFETFQITSDHCNGGGGCGNQTPFGVITVDEFADGSLLVNVHLLNGNTFVNTGFPLSFGFNVAGVSSLTYSLLTNGWGVPDGTGAGGMTQASGSYSQDGTGTFQYGVLWGAQGGGHGTSQDLNFMIQGTGLSLDALSKNADGQYFAIDILSGTTGKTGNVDASSHGDKTPFGGTPDGGSTILLLGLSLLGLGIAGARKVSVF